jgi:PTH1 family peptidyl-tRNA hydrolase
LKQLLQGFFLNKISQAFVLKLLRMKYLIIGLGNIGDEYANTRHNIGFDIADELAKNHNASFETQRHADYAHLSIKGRQLHIIKPNTYMNLSGKAVRYWMNELEIKVDSIFVLVDDLAIDFGKLRIRGNGSDAGHNGLKNINELLQTQNYPRLRFGIGNNYPKGRQVDYVLGKFNNEEQKFLPELIDKSVKSIESFALRGLANTMNEFNK